MFPQQFDKERLHTIPRRRDLAVKRTGFCLSFLIRAFHGAHEINFGFPKALKGGRKVIKRRHRRRQAELGFALAARRDCAVANPPTHKKARCPFRNIERNVTAAVCADQNL